MCDSGIVVFDDYGFFGCEGVTAFVDRELRGQPRQIVLHNLNGHAVVVKTAA
jgi:O-methyltransferase